MHWRTARGRRLGEQRMAVTWLKRRTELGLGGFRRFFWRERRSFDRVERDYRVRRHAGVLRAAAGGKSTRGIAKMDAMSGSETLYQRWRCTSAQRGVWANISKRG